MCILSLAEAKVHEKNVLDLEEDEALGDHLSEEDLEVSISRCVVIYLIKLLNWLLIYSCINLYIIVSKDFLTETSILHLIFLILSAGVIIALKFQSHF